MNPNASHICRDPNVHEVPPNVHLSKVQPSPNTHLAGEMGVECKHQAFTVCAVCVYFKDTFLLMLIAAAVKTGFNVKFTEKANYAANHFLCCLCV